MKITQILTKKLIIEALRTEPLVSGAFFRITNETDQEVHTCEVCAVGAVMRKSGIVKKLLQPKVLENYGFEANDIATNTASVLCNQFISGDNWCRLIKEKNYLGALSNFFENEEMIHSGPVLKKTRRRCIEFVKLNFPDQFKVEVDV